jgi:hypothetical protein
VDSIEKEELVLSKINSMKTVTSNGWDLPLVGFSTLFSSTEGKGMGRAGVKSFRTNSRPNQKSI